MKKSIRKWLHFGAFTAASISASLTFAATGPNIVTNGGFDDKLDGWTEIDPTGHGGANYQGRYLDNPSPTGGNNYGLQTWRGNQGGDSATSAKGIFQSITGLTPGHDYQLSYYQTGSDFRWAGEYEYWNVTLGGQSIDGNRWSGEPGDANYLWSTNWNRTSGTGDSINDNFRWNHVVLTFTATAVTEKLTFREQQGLESAWDTSVTPYGTPAVFLIDGITLRDLDYVAAVPEASTAGLSLLGLTLLGFVASRRKARKPGAN